MADRLKGRVAVVTGSGQGIGRAIAIGLAREGARVVTNNRRPGSTGLSAFGEELAKRFTPEEVELARSMGGDAATVAREITDIGGEAVPFFGDIGNFETAGKLIKTAISTFGKIDILVNNASSFSRGPVWQLTEDAWDLVLRSKLHGAFNCIRHAAGPMKEQQWGRILNCTAVGWLGNVDQANYATANAGMVGLTRAVARELYQYGITCNAYAPHAMTRAHLSGKVRRRQMAEAGTRISNPEREAAVEESPRPPEGVAPFIVYLATEQAAHISGTVFDVHGNGEYSIFSEPEIRTGMKRETGVWTVDELIEKAPQTLLKDYKTKAGSTPYSG